MGTPRLPRRWRPSFRHPPRERGGERGGEARLRRKQAIASRDQGQSARKRGRVCRLPGVQSWRPLCQRSQILEAGRPGPKAFSLAQIPQSRATSARPGASLAPDGPSAITKRRSCDQGAGLRRQVRGSPRFDRWSHFRVRVSSPNLSVLQKNSSCFKKNLRKCYCHK